MARWANGLAAAVFSLAGFTAPAVSAQRVDPDEVNKARLETDRRSPGEAFDPAILRLQILLDRAGFSPGEIDGRDGENTRKAVAAFARSRDLPDAGRIQAALDTLISEDDRPVLTTAQVSHKEADYRFIPEIPGRMEDQAGLDRLAYRDPAELIGERYHMAPALLAALNPESNLERSGEEIVVAAVEPMAWEPPKRDPKAKPRAVRVEIDKSARQLVAFAEDGRRLAVMPASVGSEEKPAPSGDTSVKGVAFRPNYTYDPDYAFRGVSAKSKFVIAPGPNNPVGVVWIDLAIPSYGIHGTPEPSKVGKTASHGCIRLTNWDAMTLATWVGPGTEVVFRD